MKECGLAMTTQTGVVAAKAAFFQIAKLKDAFRHGRMSEPLQKGWCHIPCGELQLHAHALGDWHAAHPDSRVLLDPDTRKSWGRVERLSLCHWEPRRCFDEGDVAWDTILRSFRRGTPSGSAAARRAASTSAWCSLPNGCSVELTLMLGAFPDPPPSQDDEVMDPTGRSDGVAFDLDLTKFNAFFEDEDCRDDMLHVKCFVLCGGRRRTSRHLLGRSGPVFEFSRRFLWHLPPSAPYGLRSTIEIRRPDRSVELIDEEVVNARWNTLVTSSPISAPLAWASDNQYAATHAAKPLTNMSGRVALVRRGGGCGFAQKAMLAQEAGAVACIVYEAEGDREMMGRTVAMGTRFCGVDFPAPSIPCLLVGTEHGKQLLDLAISDQGGIVHISLGDSEAALRTPPTSFTAFQQASLRGDPVHAAVLVERIRSRCPSA